MPSQIEQAANYFSKGDLHQASLISKELINRNPNDSNALHLLGVIHLNEKKPGVAIAYLEKALSCKPNNIDIAIAFSQALLLTQQFSYALDVLHKFLNRSVNFSEACQQYIHVVAHINNLQESISALDLYQQARPNDTQTFYTALYKTYVKFQDYGNALEIIDKIHKTDNRNADVWSDKGIIYLQINNPKDAEYCFYKSLEITQNHLNANLNLASLLQNQGKLAEAKQIYTCVLSNHTLNNSNSQQLAKVHYNLALIYLSENQLSLAWSHLIGRPKQINTSLPSISELSGKSVLIIGEEGIGDEILFIRYCKLLVNQVSHFGYICNPKLSGLLKQNNFFTKIHHTLSDVSQYDYCISLMDLPYIFAKNDNIAPPPFQLHANPIDIITTTQQLANQGNRPFIGITWQSGKLIDDSRSEKFLEKSIPLKKMVSLFQGFTGTLVVLQREVNPEDLQYLENNLSATIVNASQLNDDLEKMLVMLSVLDEYVGVSNSNTHLYGALNKSAKVLIPYPSEWRWLSEGDTSPWYPQFTLYRQTHKNQWDDAIQILRKQLFPEP